MNTNIIELLLQLKKEFNSIDNIEEKVQMLNLIKNNLKEISPFMDPVDNVKWIPMNKIKANSYNPNRVAGPEMKLLYDSIKCDGYTQPIVVSKQDDGTADDFNRESRNTSNFNDKNIDISSSESCIRSL